MHRNKKFNIDLQPAKLEFAVFSSDEIKRLSVVKVITGLTFDPLGHPFPGGLYDDHMGGYGRRFEMCSTCNSGHACTGHIGHIELTALVYNPFLTKLAQRILNATCLNCFQIQLTNHVREITELQLRLADAGYIIEAQELEIYKSENNFHNAPEMLKLENGESIHPRVAEIKELLKTEEVDCNSTRTGCAVRTAIVNAAVQRATSSKCIHCSKPLINVRYLHRKLVYYMTASDVRAKLNNDRVTTGNYKVVFADECRKYLRSIYKNHSKLLDLLFPLLKMFKDHKTDNDCPVDLFFIDTLIVTPPNARPSMFVGGKIVEHPKTNIYRTIIQNNSALRVILNHIKGEVQSSTEEATQVYENAKGSTQYEKLYNAWEELQTSVEVLLDVNVAREKDLSQGQGLKQILEKKEGLLRKHMMGKRVNYAARTVITPDPNINVEEIGVPDVFAKKLTYPVPVTPWNVAELRKMVINGPSVHPGANLIQDEKGSITLIPAGNPSKRESIAKLLFNYPENGVKIVHRHVINGDILLLNRQPSLHKPSIMAHKARILMKERTFRLHYSNCKAYNADFDGDEMNAHLPQNEVARSEAYNLVNVASNYLVPKDGTPLGGLIQDHVISGVKLSIRGRFFNRDDYHQLVYQGLAEKRGDLKFLKPSILKPKMLWSGKQILSTIIMNMIPEDCPKINMQSVSKIQSRHWKSNSKRPYVDLLSLCESSVWIRNGELLMGVLDKQQYGATTYGLIHCVYDLYGGDVSTRLLTAFTKLFTYFLQHEGFTLGVEDILVTAEADHERRKIIKECREEGPKIVANALDLEDVPALDVLENKMKEAYRNDPKFRVVMDRNYKAVLDDYTNRINKVCLPDGLISKFPSNNLQLMILSGAKGSLVNSMQISCLLGQIELEGKRPPLMISGKSLPSFTVFETSPKSGGFIDGRFMTGIQPQDFFFHCMAGREGLIDTAVKTSRSGYLQRCLIKHLEGLSINYDLTVRDSDNSVIQFLYGEDGLDILKSKFFSYKAWREFFSMNSEAILDKTALSSIKDEDSLLKIKKYLKKLRSKRKSLKNLNKHYAPFTNFSAELRNEIEIKNPQKINSKTGRRRLDEGIIKLWKKADDESKQLYKKKCARCPDPVTSKYKPDLYYGSLPESLQSVIDSIQDPVEKEELADIIYVKAMKALASPGEPVGLIAAQSIGEPSTQMTLNTFHFAGRGEMNVTLGIPRLREILMTASSNIKTPSMDIPIQPTQLKNADKLRIKLNRVSLASVLQDIDVCIKLVLEPERAHQYELCFRFLPREAYQDEYFVKPKQIIKYMSNVFFQQLFRSVLKSSKSSASVIDLGDTKERKEEDDREDDDVDDRRNTRQAEKETSDDENGQDDDDDATGIRLKSRRLDETEYDDPEEVEEAANSSGDDDNDDEPKDDSPNLRKEAEDGPDDANNDEIVDKVMKNTIVHDYVYDKEKFLWCKLTFHLDIKYKSPDMSSLLKNLAEKSIIHQVPNIKRSIIYKGENDVQFIKTDGINIVETFKHNKILDLNRLYANDIHAIARTYGIEAAARVIIKEVANVFKVYGIAVDHRHLSLIADYMTFDGTFMPLSRKGMEFNPSPLQQMSFEASLQFLKTAIHSGRSDDLDSPSSRLMVGLPIRNGTGAFELLTKMY